MNRRSRRREAEGEGSDAGEHRGEVLDSGTVARSVFAGSPRVGAMSRQAPRPLHHIAIGVADIEAAIDWYEKVLGYRVFTGPLELTLEGDVHGQLRDVLGPKFRRLRIAHLSTGGGCGLELFESIDPPHERREEAVEFWKSGTFHFCVIDPDIEGLIERIVEHGGKQLTRIWDDRPPGDTFRMVYCQDPFGTLIEIHTHSYEIVQGWRRPWHQEEPRP